MGLYLREDSVNSLYVYDNNKKYDIYGYLIDVLKIMFMIFTSNEKM